jgi:hypothetical protein
MDLIEAVAARHEAEGGAVLVAQLLPRVRARVGPSLGRKVCVDHCCPSPTPVVPHAPVVLLLRPTFKHVCEGFYFPLCRVCLTRTHPIEGEEALFDCFANGVAGAQIREVPLHVGRDLLADCAENLRWVTYAVEQIHLFHT